MTNNIFGLETWSRCRASVVACPAVLLSIQQGWQGSVSGWIHVIFTDPDTWEIMDPDPWPTGIAFQQHALLYYVYCIYLYILYGTMVKKTYTCTYTATKELKKLTVKCELYSFYLPHFRHENSIILLFFAFLVIEGCKMVNTPDEYIFLFKLKKLHTFLRQHRAGSRFVLCTVFHNESCRTLGVTRGNSEL